MTSSANPVTAGPAGPTERPNPFDLVGQRRFAPFFGVQVLGEVSG